MLHTSTYAMTPRKVVRGTKKADKTTEEADDNNSMDNESAEGETNYWDSVDMIEDGNAADNEGNNENTADEQVSGDSEEYPGQDDGWSPIVPADDVN